MANNVHHIADHRPGARRDHPVIPTRAQLRVVSRRPAALESGRPLDTARHVDRERGPRRVAQVQELDCYGEFEATGLIGDEPASTYTQASVFQEKGRKTPTAIRFSTAIGREASEIARNPRGFVVTFYVDDGRWDLLGSNLPLSFTREAIRSRDDIHAPDPRLAGIHQEPARLFDFVSQTPESIHMLLFLFSPRGIPASYRHQQGFGVNACRMANAAGDAVLVKYHWHPRAGVVSLTAAEAATVEGQDLGSASKDLFEAIDRGEYPQWDLYVQMMEDAEREALDWDPLDGTRVWPENLFPLRHAGVLTINRRVDVQYPHRQSARMADSPMNGPGRLKPTPTSNLPLVRGRQAHSAIDPRNDYIQPRARYETMQGWERDDLVKNLSDMLDCCEREVRERMVWHFLMVHDDLGTRVGSAVGVSPKDVKKMPPLPTQVLTGAEQARLRSLGSNGDTIDARRWGAWTGSVPNTQATAEEVLDGMRTPSLTE